MRHHVIRLLPARVVALIQHLRNGGVFEYHARFSFAQEGEDLVLDRILGGQESGFFVDVGAHHPSRFSNTYLLYQRGWRGINIDATPGSMDLFRKRRPRDINLELAISKEEGVLRLHRFDESALNTVSRELAEDRKRDSDYSMIGTVDVKARPLQDVLEEYIPVGVAAIDLMTIDVEGHDFDVLKSNDWTRFRPRVLLIEILESSLRDVLESDEVQYLERRGYAVQAKIVNTVILLDSTIT